MKKVPILEGILGGDNFTNGNEHTATLPRKEPILSKASLVEKNCTVVIFEEGAYIVEGISGGDIFTDGNEQEDCNPNEDPGVETYKVCQVRFPVVIPESRRFNTQAVDRG